MSYACFKDSDCESKFGPGWRCAGASWPFRPGQCYYPGEPGKEPEPSNGGPVVSDPGQGNAGPYFPGVGELTGGPEVDITDLALAATILKLTQTPDGLKTIQVLGKALLDGAFKTLGYLGQASAANKIAAWGNPVLISAVLERIGLIKPGFNDHFHLKLSLIAGADIALDVLEKVSGFIPFTKPSDSSYPDSITYAAETK